MSRKPMGPAVVLALVASLGLSGCGKQEPPAAAPPAAEVVVAANPGPGNIPVPVPPRASVDGVVLGNRVDANRQVIVPLTEFGRRDSIIAAVSTSTTGTEPGDIFNAKLGGRWTFEDGKVIHERSGSVNFVGLGIVDFKITRPGDWTPGRYKFEVMLDDKVVQVREFVVR